MPTLREKVKAATPTYPVPSATELAEEQGRQQRINSSYNPNIPPEQRPSSDQLSKDLDDSEAHKKTYAGYYMAQARASGYR